MFMLVKGDISAGHESIKFSTTAEVRNLFAIVLLLSDMDLVLCLCLLNVCIAWQSYRNRTGKRFYVEI